MIIALVNIFSDTLTTWQIIGIFFAILFIGMLMIAAGTALTALPLVDELIAAFIGGVIGAVITFRHTEFGWGGALLGFIVGGVGLGLLWLVAMPVIAFVGGIVILTDIVWLIVQLWGPVG